MKGNRISKINTKREEVVNRECNKKIIDNKYGFWV